MMKPVFILRWIWTKERLETSIAFERESRRLTLEAKQYDAWLRREETKAKVAIAQASSELARVKVERELFKAAQEDRAFEERENARRQKFELEMARLQAKAMADATREARANEERRANAIREARAHEEHAVEVR